MKRKAIASVLLGAGLFLAGGLGAAYAEGTASVSTKAMSGTFVDFLKAHKALAEGKPIAAAHTSVAVAQPNGSAQVRVLGDGHAGGASLPLWTFEARSSRDGNTYEGAMVGTNPFTNPQSTSVPAQVVPVVFHIHSIATAIDPNTGAITYTAGDVWVNPNAPDNTCLAAPNNRPTKILLQSPIFQTADFNFGGTDMGNTQYIDAMMRGNFWNANRRVASNYHLLFAPVRAIDPIVVDVPADNGVAIDAAGFFGGCGTLTLVDIAWFDAYLNAYVMPRLADEAGVAPSNLPVFFFYNTVLGGSATVGLGNCCIGGYHSSGGFPTPTQTYSVADFDTTGLFGTAFANTAVISHELGEWANDPYGINLVPPWGNTGQVAGCQGNLEVGDPLTGTVLPTVTMPNGFPYYVQELAFFSWFLGQPSTAVNGWYSSNGTFTTDAGTPCLLQ